VKLVVAIVHADDAGPCTRTLLDSGYDCTRLSTQGGFLQKGNATLLVGVDDTQVDAVVDILRHCARGRSEFINPVPSTAEPAEFFTPSRWRWRSAAPSSSSSTSPASNACDRSDVASAQPRHRQR
jgi:uncharacterized protein YaaQ